jgi:hypothetical protein
MKTGRNDSCPCGSGKKYKKCCLSKDQAETATQRLTVPPLLVQDQPPGADAYAAMRDQFLASARTAAEEAVSPPPPDPLDEERDRRWDEFESQSEEGRRAIFLDTLEAPELLTDNIAFGMLNWLHQDLSARDDR